MAERTCSVVDCERPVFARGWCNLHYNRWRISGDPLFTSRTPPTGRVLRTPADRFWEKVDRRGDCWEWSGALFKTSGYGQFYDGNRNIVAHRFAYESANGPIADGLEIDHLCRNRRCVRPEHLEAVTPRVNNRRSDAPSAHNAVKTHCKHGHAFTPENTYVYRGERYCRACNNERQRLFRERKHF